MDILSAYLYFESVHFLLVNLFIIYVRMLPSKKKKKLDFVPFLVARLEMALL